MFLAIRLSSIVRNCVLYNCLIKHILIILKIICNNEMGLSPFDWCLGINYQKYWLQLELSRSGFLLTRNITNVSDLITKLWSNDGPNFVKIRIRTHSGYTDGRSSWIFYGRAATREESKFKHSTDSYKAACANDEYCSEFKNVIQNVMILLLKVYSPVFYSQLSTCVVWPTIWQREDLEQGLDVVTADSVKLAWTKFTDSL